MDKLNYYITGLVDGEGSFSISVQKDTTHRVGYRLKPSFSLGLHKEDLSILKRIRQNLECGTISFNKNMAQLKDYFTGKSIVIEKDQPEEVRINDYLKNPYEKTLLILAVVLMVIGFFGSLFL